MVHVGWKCAHRIQVFCFNISVLPSLWKTHSIDLIQEKHQQFLGWENINVYVTIHYFQEQLEAKKKKKVQKFSKTACSKFRLWVYEEMVFNFFLVRILFQILLAKFASDQSTYLQPLI